MCNVEYIKGSENLYLKSKNHILNKEAYVITYKQVKQENILNEDEQLKLLNEDKFKIKHVKYLEEFKIKKLIFYIIIINIYSKFGFFIFNFIVMCFFSIFNPCNPLN